MISHKLKTLFLSVFLVAGILFQGWDLLDAAIQDLIQVRNAIGQSGLWRSANFAQGQRFANYIRFLHENIPEDGRVVLPPEGIGPKSISTTPYMQFFLAPRQVINCTEPDCLENLSTENTYILAVRNFPGQALSSTGGEVHMFDDQWGVVLPKDAQPGIDPEGCSNGYRQQHRDDGPYPCRSDSGTQRERCGEGRVPPSRISRLFRSRGATRPLVR